MQWYIFYSRCRMRVYLITHHFKIYCNFFASLPLTLFSRFFFHIRIPSKQLIKYVQIGLIGLSLCPHHTEQNVFSLLGFH